MENEFRSRISTQRVVTSFINCNFKNVNEELFGLSRNAIYRWMSNNSVKDKKVVSLLMEISDKLFFLANKSQEQITREYKLIIKDVKSLLNELEKHVKHINTKC